jgi:hypothetical protein
LYLAPYGGKGTRNLIEFLEKSGRITFDRNTVEKHARKYKDKTELNFLVLPGPVMISPCPLMAPNYFLSLA